MTWIYCCNLECQDGTFSGVACSYDGYAAAASAAAPGCYDHGGAIIDYGNCWKVWV